MSETAVELFSAAVFFIIKVDGTVANNVIKCGSSAERGVREWISRARNMI